MTAVVAFKKQEFQEHSLAQEFQSKLSKRAKFYSDIIQEMLGEMGLANMVKLDILPKNLEKLSNVEIAGLFDLDVNIHPDGQGFNLVRLPFFMLCKQGDLLKYRVVIEKMLSQVELTDLNRKCLSVVYEILRDPTKVSLGKKFIMCHELSHMILGHVETPPLTSEESQERELQADRLAAQMMKTTEGGLYFFRTYATYFPKITPITHPTFERRIEQLEHLQISDAEVPQQWI